MTEWRNPEPPVSGDDPASAPGPAWASEPEQSAVDPSVGAEPAVELSSQAGPEDPTPPDSAPWARPVAQTPEPTEGLDETVEVQHAPEPEAAASPAEPAALPAEPALVPSPADPAVVPSPPESAQVPPSEPGPAPSPAETAPIPSPEAPAQEGWHRADPEPTRQLPVSPPPIESGYPAASVPPQVPGWGTQVPAAPGVAQSQPTPPAGAIFRDDFGYPGTEATEPLSDEARKLAAERAARREAREAALTATAPVPAVAPEPVVVHKRTNDKFFGSLGLFLLRLVVAAVFAVRGLNQLANIPATQAQFAQTILPYPEVLAIATGVASLLIALSLLLGLLTRVAGAGIFLIAGGAIVFALWGAWPIFVANQPGFIGEYELVLAAVGLLFLFLGAGGWSVDRSFRAGRERDRAERQLAE